MGDGDTCPRSNLLRSRCRCSDEQCYGRANATERRESRGARRNRVRRQQRRQLAEKEHQTWMQQVWREHAMSHPEMWSPGYAERPIQ